MSIVTIPFSQSTVRKQLSIMLGMQDEMNLIVFQDWRMRNLAWHRAIYIEAAEYLGHLETWKWWKKPYPDFAQANMELVDIFHFGLSWFINRYDDKDTDTLAAALATRLQTLCQESRLLDIANIDEMLDPVLLEARHDQVDKLVADAGNRIFNLAAFIKLLGLSGVDLDALFQRYIGKNILNRFRQAHGYKTGGYIKIWQGEEDNVHLDRFLDVLPPNDDLPAALYAALETKYAEVIGN